VDRATKLLAMLETESEAASLDDRARAGDELAALGDPRAKAVDRVLIPAGPFVFRGKSQDDDDARRVEISAFRIDRYPVTVAAFAEFIGSGGYTERRFWTARGWSWRTRERITCPRFWGEAEWAAYLIPNHPVVGVSAYEAEAYAAFRGARLPTEAEWEKACRGPDGRCYPWGSAWRDGACAMRGVGPRGTLPIGVFPAGRSPYDVRDMVGCVWQWCADVLDEDEQEHAEDDTDPFIDPEDYDEAAPRVTRGGAWNTLQWSITCTSRNGYPPTARFSNLGFRCASD
jgi:formylglycine-generating enzyme required for sulfatase activity